MNTFRGMRFVAFTSVGALALTLAGTSGSQAAPGDWVNISGLAAGTGYPEVSTSSTPTLKYFGDEVQVAWAQADGTNVSAIYVAALDSKGSVLRGPAAAVTSQSMNQFPQLLSYQGQRALSLADQSSGQRLATSADGVTWTLNPGSLSATNLANVSSGGGTVVAQSPATNTLIWAGAPNMGSVTWHVGMSGANPASEPDQVYDPPSSQDPSAVNVVYEASTQKTYAAYYAAEGGTFFAEIAPNYSGFSQVPGSQIRSIYGAGSGRVPMAARDQGGVYVAFLDPSESRNSEQSLIVREMNSGKTWTIANSKGADKASLAAAPNGRVWLTFEKGDEMFVAQTDPSAVAFGSPKSWGSPQRGTTIYAAGIAGDNNRAFIGVNTTVGGDQNIAVTPVLPNLTIDVVGKAKAGKSVTLRVRDGGAPVRNARVKVGNNSFKSGKGGVVKFTAPRAGSMKVTALGPGYASSSRNVGLR